MFANFQPAITQTSFTFDDPENWECIEMGGVFTENIAPRAILRLPIRQS